MNHRTTFALGVVCGTVLEIASLLPMPTGKVGLLLSRLYWPVGTMAIGAIVGAIGPGRLFWLWPFAICFGQAVHTIGWLLFDEKTGAQEQAVSFIVVAISVALAFLGSALGAGCRVVGRKLRRKDRAVSSVG